MVPPGPDRWPARLLRNRVEAQWRLLDDLGWDLAAERDSYELREDHRRVLAVVRYLSA